MNLVVVWLWWSNNDEVGQLCEEVGKLRGRSNTYTIIKKNN